MSKSKKNDTGDLKIRPVEDNTKDKIAQPDLAEKRVIPRINTSNLFVGNTEGGKSTLMQNLVMRPQFFGGKQPNGKPWFDVRLLVSPTGDTDDVQKALKLSDNEIETDLKKVPNLLRELMAKMKRLIKEKGADGAPKVLIMYDDIISHPKFMRDPQFIKTFIANRHHNFTVFICSQSWTKLPRAVRLQARGIFFFEGSSSEVDHLCDEYCPPNLTRHDFRNMVRYATQDNYAFLYINKSVPMKERFRKNLTEIIQIPFFEDSKKNPEFALPDKEEKTGDTEKENKQGDEENEDKDTIQKILNETQLKPTKLDKTVITRSQQGTPYDDHGFTGKRGRTFFERDAAASAQSFKQKSQNSHFSRSRRLKSSYYT